ncbi:transporter substrate-binding domain-containing protein [Temperatibacter marinus]|uniref:Transporter substrate-binding domain-containing protein n=1 Tax=Temperatibacter marinus TaxID=1456591 RepID=A0AA52EI75_9PROT|nr:transporter substrate-binding domain-containing protein [Temperatibacter marinus]WND03633.1 transporter substrate-binding domain-containing protein [Temperatibacter marinus]
MKQWILSLIAVSFLTSYAMAQEDSSLQKKPIVLHTFIQKNRLEPNLAGGYGRLLRYIQKNSSQNFEMRPYYLTRALRNFENDPSGCFFPSPPETIGVLIPSMKGQSVRYSLPIDYISGHLFSHSSVPKITSFEQVEGLKFGVLNDSIVEPLFGDKLNTIELVRVRNDRQNMNMLMRRRVNYVFGWAPDNLLMAEDLDFTEFSYDPSLKFFETTTHVVCKKTPENDAVLSTINAQIKQLQTSGIIRFILSKHANPVEYGSRSYVRYPFTGINIELEPVE